MHLPLSEGTDTVPAQMQAMVADVAGGQPLHPIALLETVRTVRRLIAPDGNVLAEVADDEVTARRLGPERRSSPMRWHEIEVELVSGPPSVLEAAGKLLREAGARPSASASKLGPPARRGLTAARRRPALGASGSAWGRARARYQWRLHELRAASSDRSAPGGSLDAVSGERERAAMTADDPAPASAGWTALGCWVHLVVTDPAALERPARCWRPTWPTWTPRAAGSGPIPSSSRSTAREGRPVRLSPLLASAVAVALRAAELTDGDVDPTVGEAIVAAGYDRDFSLVPPDGPALNLVVRAVPGWRQVRLDPATRTLAMPRRDTAGPRRDRQSVGRRPRRRAHRR